MASREICIWLDEHWYKALSKHLKDETLEEYLENAIDELCNQLPEREYERVSSLIWEEHRKNREEQEQSRRFAVFHVTEHGTSSYFSVEEPLEALQVAARLRSYIRKSPEQSPASFHGMFSRGKLISCEEFDSFASERMENTGRVTGAFHIDLDKGTMDSLLLMDGWKCFRIKDMSTAAYFAMKKSDTSLDERWKIFLDHLHGKELTHASDTTILAGSHSLRAEDISFSGDIMQDDQWMEFYMEVVFDADKVFGTNVCTTENDDFINVYARYDLLNRCPCDTLDVYLVRGDGIEQDYKYQLSDEEKALLLPKMEEFCLRQWGQTLDQCSEDYQLEQEQEQMQEMQM